MEQFACIFCDKVSDNTVIEENGYEGRKCGQCGLIYTTPRPSREEIRDLYGHDNAHLSAESHIASEFPKRLYARHHLNLIAPHINSGALLEMGAGGGYFLDEARKRGFNPFAIEFNPAQAESIRKRLGIPCEETPLANSVFDGQRFDIVYHCDVISHFHNPIAEFSAIHDKLKPNGLVVFETGNLGDVDEKYFPCFEKFQYPDHVYFFSEQNLLTLLKKTGFELVDMHRYSILPQLRMAKLLSPIKRWLQKKKAKGIAPPVLLAPDSSQKRTRSQAGLPRHTPLTYLKQFLEWVFYCLRYPIGSLAARPHCPQTIIVIARKK